MSDQPQFPENYPPVQNDPFPKMIIVFLAITFVGLFVIFGILLFEFIQRGQSKNVGMGTPIQQMVPVHQNPNPPTAPLTPVAPGAQP